MPGVVCLSWSLSTTRLEKAFFTMTTAVALDTAHYNARMTLIYDAWAVSRQQYFSPLLVTFLGAFLRVDSIKSGSTWVNIHHER